MITPLPPVFKEPRRHKEPQRFDRLPIYLGFLCGQSYNSIAKEMGMGSTTVREIAKKLGITRSAFHRRADKKIRLIMELHDEGLGCRRIARKLGMSKDIVSYHIRTKLQGGFPTLTRSELEERKLECRNMRSHLKDDRLANGHTKKKYGV